MSSSMIGTPLPTSSSTISRLASSQVRLPAGLLKLGINIAAANLLLRAARRTASTSMPLPESLPA